MDKPAHHRVDVVRIEEIFPHGNADKLEIIKIGGYQCVVVKDQFQVGSLAYYVPPDSIVPDRPEYGFLWNNEVFEGGTPVKKRRISARRFRKEWSEGLLMPLAWNDRMAGWTVAKSPAEGVVVTEKVDVGTDVSDFLEITHYEPPEETNAGISLGGPKKFHWPRTWGGWKQLILGWLRGERREAGLRLPEYDVDALKKFPNAFTEGEMVYAREKIHGSNIRICYKKTIFGKGKLYVGSRKLWKASASTCAWRKCIADNPWIESWCQNHPDYALYGEITPTQKGFDYGSNGKVKFFLFDIRKPDGQWATREEVEDLFYAPGIERWANTVLVPEFYYGPYDSAVISKFVDGPSAVPGASHIREGIVIRSDNPRKQYKWVSNVYLEKSAS